MAGHLAAQKAVCADAPPFPTGPCCASSSSLLSGASGRGLEGGCRGPSPLSDFWASSGAPGVCWACLWPQDPAWAGWCTGQKECDPGDKDQARWALRAGLGLDPSLFPAHTPCCLLPPTLARVGRAGPGDREQEPGQVPEYASACLGVHGRKVEF